MKNYIIECSGNFRMSEIATFDPEAKGAELMGIRDGHTTTIWQVSTTLYLSQITLLKNVVRGVRQFQFPPEN